MNTPITLSKPFTNVIQQQKTETVSTLTVVRVVDIPSQKLVRCFCKELKEPVVLWEGTTYDSIGNWTDENVTNRLTEIFTLGATASH